MAITFNESSVGGEPFGAGVLRPRLLTGQRVEGTRILLDRLALGAGSVAPVEIGPRSLGWFQMLGGTATLTDVAGGATDIALGDSHVAFLPPGFRGTLASSGGAQVLFAEVPSAADLDPKLCSEPPPLRVIDWRREPVLDSEHDARKRIYLVTPKLFGTTAIKGEMIIYPPGTSAANHHHEGAGTASRYRSRARSRLAARPSSRRNPRRAAIRADGRGPGCRRCPPSARRSAAR